MSSHRVPPQFTFRPAESQDAQAVTAVITAAERHDIGEIDVSLEDIISDWARSSFDLDADTRVVSDGDEVVGYAEAFGQRAFVHVHPRVRGHGIGNALRSWTEQRARASGAEWVGQTLSEHETAARELLTAHGYVKRWDTWVFQRPLADDLPDAAAPSGVTLRTLARPADERAVYEVIDTAFDEWPDRDPGHTFEDWRATTLDRPDTDPQLVFVALDGERVVGAAACQRFGDEGWIDQLAVARSHRGRGLGAALLHAAFAEFRRRGLRTTGLSTDSRTGARDLYERVGMTVVRSYARFGKRLR